MKLFKKIFAVVTVCFLLTGIVSCSLQGDANPESEQRTSDKGNSKLKENENKTAITMSITGDDKKGTIVGSTSVAIEEGDTVLDALQKVTRSRGIQLSVRGSGASAYIEGIGNLYEFDRGPMSGWKVQKNGEILQRSAGTTSVKDGDRVKWYYTSDYTKDE